MSSKKTDLTVDFFIIKTRHPDGHEKTDLGGEKQQWEVSSAYQREHRLVRSGNKLQIRSSIG